MTMPAAPAAPAAPAPAAAPVSAPAPVSAAPAAAPKPATPSPAPARAPRAPVSSLPKIEPKPTVSAKQALGLDADPSVSMVALDRAARGEAPIPVEPNPAARTGAEAAPVAAAPTEPLVPEAAPAPVPPAAPAVAPAPVPAANDEAMKQIADLQKQIEALKKPAEPAAPAPVAETPEQKAAREANDKKRISEWIGGRAQKMDFSAAPISTQEDYDAILAGGPEGFKAFEASMKRAVAHGELAARQSIFADVNPVAESFRRVQSELWQAHQNLQDYGADQQFSAAHSEFASRMDLIRGIRETLRTQFPDKWHNLSPEQQSAELLRQGEHQMTQAATALGYQDWRQLPAAVAPVATPPPVAAVPAPLPVVPTALGAPAAPPAARRAAAPPAPPAPPAHAPNGAAPSRGKSNSTLIAESLRE